MSRGQILHSSDLVGSSERKSFLCQCQSYEKTFSTGSYSGKFMGFKFPARGATCEMPLAWDWIQLVTCLKYNISVKGEHAGSIKHSSRAGF